MILFFTQNISYKIQQKRFYKQWIKDIAKQHNVSNGDINIIFCSADDLLNINKRFLNHDYHTDVITFDYSDLTSKRIIAGDIYIGIETVRTNAKVYGASSFEQELRRVIAHGIFHLLGFSDKTPEDQAYMRNLEEVAIKRFDEMCVQ
ncbi:MAG: rRNA maturation RNase YbeY [Prevotellaceae bacterium]|nr:rRNA maturation RNase YbeY [Prevotellaceae bacterium]